MSDGSFEEYTDCILEPLKQWTFSIHLLSTPALCWKQKKIRRVNWAHPTSFTGHSMFWECSKVFPQLTIREKKFTFKILRLSKLAKM